MQQIKGKVNTKENPEPEEEDEDEDENLIQDENEDITSNIEPSFMGSAS